MKFVGDLHIHSKFSRATSKKLDFEHLHTAAQLKGVTVVGTGDFTHPGWYSEIAEKLSPAEPGLLRLNQNTARRCDEEVPTACRRKVRFILSAEISNIYKKNGKTRKNHNLVFLPDLDAVRRFNATLDKIGNIQSDGRPILGLDAKHLLEIVLETHEQGFLVPAHIWTPWFSLLGSKSGFDTVEECFEDLTPHIFALETGLSSDPPMNRRLSALDRYTLISNSDAHSPLKLGREANIFDTDLSYFAIRSAMAAKDPKTFLGTVEFYPEEGKYHLDGHRKCNVRTLPDETVRLKGLCPECGKPLTIGVLYRVMELADRTEVDPPERASNHINLIPLAEILAEIFGVGPGSKRVQTAYHALLERFGAELDILAHVNADDLEAGGIPLLSEAVRRMRKGNITLSPGFDGTFGRLTLFNPSERRDLMKQASLFTQFESQTATGGVQEVKKEFDLKTGNDAKRTRRVKKNPSFATNNRKDRIIDQVLAGLNPEQRQAVNHDGGPVMVIAGPGTGKTLTLTHRIAFLITRKKVPAERILAVTFTIKAAEEMRQRLRHLLGPSEKMPRVATFHAFCHGLQRQMSSGIGDLVVDEVEKKEWMARALKTTLQTNGPINLPVRDVFQSIDAAKQNLVSPEDIYIGGEFCRTTRTIATAYRTYRSLLSMQNLCDYEDLIQRTVRCFEARPDILEAIRQQYDHLLVDEYQDLNYGQYRLLKLLTPPGGHIFVIGDPDQAIYGFRGADARFFHRFRDEHPGAACVHLTRNYRSTQTILDASHHILAPAKSGRCEALRAYSGIRTTHFVHVLETPSARSEAVAVGQQIEKLMGGTGFHSMDFGHVDRQDRPAALGFSDFAVLYRTQDQGEVLAEILRQYGIPCLLSSKQHLVNQKGLTLIISWLKLIDGNGSYIDLERLLSGLGISVRRLALERFIGWAIDLCIGPKEALHRIRRIRLADLKKEDQQQLADFARDLDVLSERFKRLNARDRLECLCESLPPFFLDQHPGIVDDLGRLLESAGDASAAEAAFVTRFALQTDTDLYEKKAQKVTLMTMHAAKGLEFPVVFITGCEDGLIPLKPPDGKVSDLEEERRLFYVAATRAKELLYLTRARKRRIYGRIQNQPPSPFLSDIKPELTAIESSEPRSAKPSPKQPLQLKLF